MVLVQKDLKNAYIGEYIAHRTFTISWTEQSNMSSGWTYSDDAAGLTAGSGDFDDFFGYSAVLLNTSGVETAEMKQSGGVFTGAMTTLGNITSGDNVMIKFPVRGIKMTKSGSVVTLSITEELNKTGYQYYAHTSSGNIDSPGTPQDAFYLGAYKGYNNSGVLKSWSGQTPTASQTQANFCTYAKANGSGHNIIGFYQRMYIAALYMMKYGNPNSQSTIGLGYYDGVRITGGRNSETNANYGYPSTQTQIRLFGLEDWWGSLNEWIGGCYVNGSRYIYTMLTNWSGALSGGTAPGVYLLPNSSYDIISSIVGDSKVMFAPNASNGYEYSGYYCDYTRVNGSTLLDCGGRNSGDYRGMGVFAFNMQSGTSSTGGHIGTRLMYLNGLT